MIDNIYDENDFEFSDSCQTIKYNEDYTIDEDDIQDFDEFIQFHGIVDDENDEIEELNFGE